MLCNRCNCTSALQLIDKENTCMGHESFATTSTLKINNFSMIKIKVGKRVSSAAGNTPLVLLDAYQQYCTVSREATSARRHRWPERNTGFIDLSLLSRFSFSIRVNAASRMRLAVFGGHCRNRVPGNPGNHA